MREIPGLTSLPLTLTAKKSTNKSGLIAFTPSKPNYTTYTSSIVDHDDQRRLVRAPTSSSRISRRAGLRLWGARGHIFVGGPGPHFLGALF